MIIKLKVEGTEYEWDSDRLLVAEARELKVHTGFTPPRWLAALDEQDPDALAALIYMAKKRAGESLRFSDLDTLDYADFELEVEDPDAENEEEQEGGGAGEADPTVESGESGATPTPDSGPISDTSPTSSSTAPVMSVA